MFTVPLTAVEFFCFETLYDCVSANQYFTKTFLQEPVKCQAPENPENGHSSGEIYTVGAEVTFSCEEGYQLLGVGKVTCLETGEWDHVRPSCEGTCRKWLGVTVLGSSRETK